MSQQTDLAVLVQRPLSLNHLPFLRLSEEPWVGIVVQGELYSPLGCLLTVVVPQSWYQNSYKRDFRVTLDRVVQLSERVL